jgi:hypothetical protein
MKSAMPNIGTPGRRMTATSPQRKLANEKPQGVTVDYDELLKTWKAQAPVKKG